MSAVFRKCLKWEVRRAKTWRMTEQGAFESAMLSLDRHVESFDDPSKIAVFSDGGAGAEGICSFDEDFDCLFYTRRTKIARRCLSRNFPELVEVFNLIVRNGKNRQESITEIAIRHHIDRNAAKVLYWRHLKKISLFFKVQ